MGGRAAIVAGISIVALLSLTSCQTASSRTARYVESGPPRYEISCPVGEECNEAVALLVGLSAPTEPTRCTAALIGPRTAVTAGHCVAWELATGGSCDGVWLGFAEGDGRPSQWVACRRVTSVSAPTTTLLSPDYAVLELNVDPGRRALAIEASQPALLESPPWFSTMVSVTADRFYDDLHEVRTRRCVVGDNRQIASQGAADPAAIRLLSSCPIREGSSGAPILDRHGRMRGLIHAGGPRYFALGLMTLLPQQVEREHR